MDSLILKIIEEGRTEHFFRLRAEVASSPLYKFVKGYVNKYSSLPPLAECLKHTSESDFSAPFDYYWEQYETQRLTNLIMELDIEELNKKLEEGKPREAVEIFKKFVDRLGEEGDEQGWVTFKALIKEFEEYVSRPPIVRTEGITTGWPTLDKVSMGCQPGDLCLVTGRVKTGKTMALLHMSKEAHLSGAKVMVVSMEMTLLQVARRLFALYAGMPYEAIRTRQLSTPGRRYLGRVLEGLKELPEAFFVEGSFIMGLWRLKSAILSARPDIVYIDGAYLLKVEGSYKKPVWEAAKEVADGLKAIALSTNVPIVASFQLTREVTKRKSDSVGLEHIHLTDALSANCSWAVGIFDVQGDPSKKLVRVLGARESEAEDFLVNYNWEQMDFSEIEEVTYD